MKHLLPVRLLALLALCAGSSIGCASNEEPARQAVSAAEAALNALRKDGATYAPEALQYAEADLAALKGEIDRGRYDEVLVASPKFNETLNYAKQIIADRQLRTPGAKREFEQLQHELPTMMDRIEKRIAELSTRDHPAQAASQSLKVTQYLLESMRTRWANANALFAAGNAIDAVDKGHDLRDEALRVSAQLGISPA